MKRAMALVVVLLVLPLAACKSTADKEADACTQLHDLQQAVTEFQALGPNSTISQFQDAADKVWNAARDAAKAVRDVEGARFQDLRDAGEQLHDAKDKVSDNATAVQALQQVQPQVQNVVNAAKALTSSLNCQ
jgi:hypothetical protein